MKSIHKILIEITMEYIKNNKADIVRLYNPINANYDDLADYLNIARATLYNRNSKGFTSHTKESVEFKNEINEYLSQLNTLWLLKSTDDYNNFINLFKSKFENSDFSKSNDYTDKFNLLYQKYKSSQNKKTSFFDFLLEFLFFDCNYLKKQKSNKNTTGTEYSDTVPELVPQKLTIINTGESSNKFEYENSDYSFFKKHKRLLILGPGGQGKSRLLSLLSEENKKKDNKKFKHIFIISLATIISNISSLDTNKNIIKEHIKFIKGKNFNSEVFKDNMLICLDGYNELVAGANQYELGLIKESIKDLSLNHQNHSIIITSRKVTSDEKNTIFSNFEIATLSDIPDRNIEYIKQKFTENNNIISDEVLELAKIPMYYNIIKDLSSYSEIKLVSKYDIFLKCYTRKAEQRLSDRNNNYNKTIFKYHFFVALPVFAKMLDESKTVKLTETELDNTISAIFNYFFTGGNINNFAKPLAKSISGNLGFSNWYDTEINKNNILLPFFEDTIICKDNNGYYYIHDNWRDFLCAFYIINNLHLLKENYSNNSLSKLLQLNQNVNKNTAELTLQGLNLFGNKQENEQQFLNLFSTPDKNDIIKQMKCILNSDINSIIGLSKWYNASVDIIEYLQLNVPLNDFKCIESLHLILDNFIHNLFDLCDSDDDYILQIANNKEIKENIIYILAKESEYYRRNRDFNNAQKCVTLGYNINSTNSFIINQKAKLYLCYFQSNILKEPINKTEDLYADFFTNIDELKAFNKKDKREFYHIGINVLEKNVINNKNFLSANLLGMIMSRPAPYLVKNDIVSGLDHKKALQYYLEIIFNSEYSRREISYTIVSALSLLINGYVAVNETKKYNDFTKWNKLTKKELVTDDINPRNMNGPTKVLVNKIIEKAEGQDLNLLNYLRGSIELINGKLDLAKIYFSSPLKSESERVGINLYYKVSMFYNFNSNDEALLSEIKESINKMFFQILDKNNNISDGVIDNTHPIYYYLDIKQLVLSYDKDFSNYFEDLEKNNFGVQQLCKKIETLSKQ